MTRSVATALLPSSARVPASAEPAIVAALAQAPMAGFDGLHDTAFDCACAIDDVTPAGDYACGLADADAEWRWLPLAATLAAVGAAVLSWFLPWGICA